MEGTDAGGDAGAEAPAQDSSGPTSTGDMPIAPVYAGAVATYSFRPLMRSLKKSLFSEQFYKRPDTANNTDFHNPYVPSPMGPRGGIDVQRHMAGTGIPYSDPLDNFKPGHLEIEKKTQPVRRDSRPVDPSRQRKRGTSTYRKMNKDNIDAGGMY